jgi:translocation and assembly module TamA
MPLPTTHRSSLSRHLLTLLAVGFSHTGWAELSLSGIDSDIASAINDQSPLTNAVCDAPDWWIEKQLEKTQEIARQLLETQGFYQPAFNADHAIEGDCWRASIAITQGPQATFSMLNIQGIEALDINPSLLEEWLPVTGDPFTHKRYEDLKANLMDFARERGFLEAAWSNHRVIVRLPSQASEAPIEQQNTQADVELALTLGPQFYVGNIEHKVADIDAEFLAKFYDLRQGAPLIRDALDAAYQDLISTGYLASLSITPQYAAAKDNQVPVILEAIPARKRTYEIGAGYATDSGARARGEIRWRRINDQGDRARLTATVAQNESELSGEYRRADLDDPRNRWLSLGASYEFDEPDTYRREKTAITATQSHRREDAWLRSNVLQYSSEVWRIANTEGDTQLVSLGQGWQTSQGHGRGRLHSGHSLNLSWRGAAKAVGSDIDVLQIQAAYKHIYSINTHWRLLSRAHAGINLVDDLDVLPPDIRFFAGGDNSVRGYDLDTLGEVRLVEGKSVVIGGKRILDGALELDRAINKDWSLALFADAGSAFNNAPNIAVGAGFGARWYSPLGPIRIDIAHGFDGLSPGWRLHISFGAEL